MSEKNSKRSIVSSLEERFGVPPLGQVLKVVSGKTPEKLDSILKRIDGLSKDRDSIEMATKLLVVIGELDERGTLDKVITLLDKLPKGASGEKMMGELKKLAEDLFPKIEKWWNEIAPLLKG